ITSEIYQCPSDFVTFCHEPCRSTWTKSLKDDNSELWLIKAPTGFNPESFQGVKVALSGLQTFRIPSDGGQKKIYNILASNHSPSELRLLTANCRPSKPMVLGPAFSGLVNVCESYEDGSAERMPHVIPAAPPPSIPVVLKRRVQTPPALSEVDGNATTEENKKNRKKRKKEKRLQEAEEGVTVKQEVEEVLMEGEKTRRRKKKKKKEREEVGVGQCVEVKEEQVSVKSEPLDSSYGDVTENYDKKKKKKKKKSKHNDD
uniref:CD3e molecule, epsilon associated protein n=1 Tax=Gouania willdenowi TaxID=441366 RepID=A0A8C5GFB4_GOUWI